MLHANRFVLNPLINYSNRFAAVKAESIRKQSVQICIQPIVLINYIRQYLITNSPSRFA